MIKPKTKHPRGIGRRARCMWQEADRPWGRKDAHPERARKRQAFVEYQGATLIPNPVVAQPHPGASEKPFEEAELAENLHEFSLSIDQGERTTVSIALHERRMDSPVTRAPEVSAKYVAANPRDETKEEVGLRLLVPDGEMGQLQTTEIIAQHARNGAVARQLEALYYDTADRALFTHGLSEVPGAAARRSTRLGCVHNANPERADEGTSIGYS